MPRKRIRNAILRYGKFFFAGPAETLLILAFMAFVVVLTPLLLRLYF